MRKGITRYALALGLALGLWAAFAALPASAKTDGNPTPCPGQTAPTKSIVMGGTIVYVNFAANPEGFVPNCDYAYTESLRSQNGANMAGSFSIRIWVCGHYQGDYQQGYSGSNVSWQSPWFYYGTCGRGADNLDTTISIGTSSYFICYQCAGYQNF